MADEREEPEGPAQPAAQRVELSIPFATIVKVLVAALVVLAVLKLWLPFLVFLVAVLIAVTLAPVVLLALVVGGTLQGDPDPAARRRVSDHRADLASRLPLERR